MGSKREKMGQLRRKISLDLADLNLFSKRQGRGFDP